MNRYDNERESYDILDEYVDITNKINEIQNILNRYREVVRERLEKAVNENEKKDIILKFKIKMKQIRKSELITTRYKKLKNRQSEIRSILLSDDSDSETDSSSEISNYSDRHNLDSIPKNGEDILSLLEDIKSKIS